MTDVTRARELLVCVYVCMCACESARCKILSFQHFSIAIRRCDALVGLELPG
jgi:hypothetical protein